MMASSTSLNQTSRLCSTNRKGTQSIQKLLDRDILDFRLKTFRNFSLELSVKSSSNAGEVHDIHGNFIGYDSYDFEPYSKHPNSMWTRISTFDREKVEIWYRQNWHPVHAYLKHLRPAIDWNFASSDFTAETQLRRSQQQQRWWAANGKVFRFLDLPAEIRELVYEYAIGPKVEPYPTARTRKLGTNGCAALVARMPNASLLLTNKLVYEEASDVLFRRTRFYVDQLGVLAKLLRNEEQSARIRRLELALSHLEFFKLFGMHCKDEIFFETRHAAFDLQNMHLDRLIIRFAAPSAITSADWLDGACQKGAVNWILDEAWPFIRRHAASRVLDIRGYVKRSSRSCFRARVVGERVRIYAWQHQRLAAGKAEGELGQYYEQLDEEDGGVPLNVYKDPQDPIKDQERKLFPFICTCRKRCSGKQWSSRD